MTIVPNFAKIISCKSEFFFTMSHERGENIRNTRLKIYHKPSDNIFTLVVKKTFFYFCKAYPNQSIQLLFRQSVDLDATHRSHLVITDCCMQPPQVAKWKLMNTDYTQLGNNEDAMRLCLQLTYCVVRHSVSFFQIPH
jgi:hypothetical protein